MKRLIVNADDFGLTSGINRGLAELQRCGSLTSATLMAVANSTSEAASMVLALPRLGVGCHVVLVDGEPALPASELPTLVDQRSGRFRATLGRFVRDLWLGRIQPAEIQAEAEAQIARLQALGIQLTHIDTHKHTHIFPRVLEPLLEAAKNQGIGAIRNPFEPDWSLAATAGAPALRKFQVQMLNRFRPRFHRLVTKAALATTDGAIGVLATGTLDKAVLGSLLHNLPDGTWELVTHPGYNDPDLALAGTRLLSSRERELEALTSAPFSREIKLIHFGEISMLDNQGR